jgi:Lrp/AsnC family leucine-responsive transcriptional regulator
VLDELDRQIITLLDKDCRVSAVEMAGHLGRSRQTIEYRIKRLEDQNIITGYTCSFNPTSVGYRLYKVYLRLRNVPEEVERLRSSLLAVGSVYWLGKTSGSWDLLFGIFYREERQILSITEHLAKNFRHIIVARTGHLIVGILQYPKMYLTGQLREYREFAGSVREVPLDDLDVKIIARLVRNARSPYNTLANSLGVSNLLVQRRMKRMEDLGVIFQYRASVNLRILGLELYKVIITTDLYSDEQHRQIVAFMSKFKELQFLVRNIWAIELELVVPNYEVLEQILDALRQNFPRLVGSLDILLLESDEWTPAFANLGGAKTAPQTVESS